MRKLNLNLKFKNVMLFLNMYEVGIHHIIIINKCNKQIPEECRPLSTFPAACKLQASIRTSAL